MNTITMRCRRWLLVCLGITVQLGAAEEDEVRELIIQPFGFLMCNQLCLQTMGCSHYRFAGSKLVCWIPMSSLDSCHPGEMCCFVINRTVRTDFLRNNSMEMEEIWFILSLTILIYSKAINYSACNIFFSIKQLTFVKGYLFCCYYTHFKIRKSFYY